MSPNRSYNRPTIYYNVIYVYFIESKPYSKALRQRCTVCVSLLPAVQRRNEITTVP